MIVVLDRNGNEITRHSAPNEITTPPRYLHIVYLRACPDSDLLVEHLAQGTVPRAHPNCPARLKAAS